MKNDKALYWIWLSQRCGIASREFGRLVVRHDDPFELYRMDGDEIEHIDGISRHLKERLCDKSLEESYSVLKQCNDGGIEVVAYTDARYPARLRTVEDPPVLLYCLGELPDMNSRLCIGTVGTRKMSEYGMETAYKISYELACARTVVVSGMAKGIDGVCACAALEAGGDTVAVLGCGLSVVYPKEHKRLMREIAKHGAVISEYPPKEPPHGYNFPKRNRIISGICQGTLIIEGGIGSGALITAARAIAQGRELFALPGNVGESNSEGPNQLIREGANVALSSEDILDYYDFLYSDVIDRKRHLQKKNSVMPSEKIFTKYGVTWKKYRERYEAPTGADKPEINADAQALEKEKGGSAKNTNDVVDTAQKTAESSVAAVPSGVLEMLDDATRKIFECMPLNGSAFTPDTVAAQGFEVGEVITALTMLEIVGLVSSLPGGMYIRT